MPLPTDAADLLVTWFGSTDPRADAPQELRQRWFGGGPVFDAELARRFGRLLDAPDAVDAWCTSLAGRVAAVVLLDQVSRNVFRGTARAFAQDARARRVAEATIEAGLDHEAGLYQRVFLYLPFEHAEDLASQERSVALFTSLAEAYDAGKGFLPYALSHRETIARFGRFPGRNAALGRPSTPAEAAWLAAGGETWGQ